MMHRSVCIALPGSLVAAAVLTLGTTTSAHAAAECGTPGTPAVYETAFHPEVYTTVPAVTHPEWRWTRQVTTNELEYSRTVSPGHDLVAWSRSTDVIEREYATTVIDQPYVPAVPPIPEVGHWETVVVEPAVTLTEWEFVHQQNGNIRWEASSAWNAEPAGVGWSPTGNSRVVELVPEVTQQQWVVDQPGVPGTPEIPEVSHTETTWVLEGESAPAGYVASGASRVADTFVENTVLPAGQVPAGAGWVQGAVVGTVDPVIDLIWVAEGTAAPDGYVATGSSRVATSTAETTDATSAVAPAGDGWTVLAGSEVTVTDVPAREELVSQAWTEEVLVEEAVPPGPDCDDDIVASPHVDPTSGGDAPDVDEAVLPNTGAAVSPWLLAAGLGSLLGGAALTAAGRRRARAYARIS